MNIRKFETEFGKWAVCRRWWIIVATILIVLAAAGGLRFLTFNKDLRVFFSEENPQLQALETLENTYGRIDNVSFAIAPKDGDVFTRSTLAAIEQLTSDSWKMPYSSRVDSITNFQHTWADEDDLIVEDLVQDAANLSQAAIAQIKKTALAEPQLVNRSLSASGHVTEVTVNILLPAQSDGEVSEIASFARALATNFRNNHPDIDLYLSGGIMFDNAFGEAGRDDLYNLVPLMFLVLLIVIGLALRSFAGTLASLIIIIASMITGMGLAGWFRMSLTPASAIAPTIIFTLAVADSIHILTILFHQMRSGKTRHQAIIESLRVNIQPVFITSVTTTIGFLSMNFSDAPPFRDLGNIVAMGVTAAFIYSILFLPALMAVLPVNIKAKASTGSNAMDSLAGFVIKRRRVIFCGMLVLIVALTFGVLRIEFNDQFTRYFDKRYDIRRATDFIEENLTGWDIIEYSLESGETGGINEPEYLSKVEEFANWYRQQAGVVHVSSITNIMKRLNKNMHSDDESYYHVPRQRDLAAQYLLLYEMSLPFGLDLNDQIDVDKSATRMIVTLRNTTAKELREMDDQARRWLKANAPETMFAYGSGLSIIWAHISERNIHSMLGASLGALLLISAILILALRHFQLGVLSIIPNLLPAFMTFGIWGIFAGQVGLALSVVVAMTLGIVVDDTVHFMSKYLRARREHNMHPYDAVRYSFNTVGVAMWVTTLALVSGFMVLSLSGYKVNSDMGMMSALTITIALVLDFLLLPILLIKLEK